MKLDRFISLVLTTEQGCRLGKACTACFLILSLFTFSTMTSSWWTELKLGSLSDSRAALQDFSSPLKELGSLIPEAHLFGSQLPPSSAMPITSSQLHLTGISQGPEDPING